MLKKLTVSSLLILMSTSLTGCYEPDEIRAVGSSTVYPFVTVAAEAFGKGSAFKTPIIESTGTGGGFKIFCSGPGTETPSISDASRPIKESERELCKQNGVTHITEIIFGYDGIVLAHSLAAPDLNLTRHELFLALARQVPKNGQLVKNFYTNWKEINPALPDSPIEVYGPPPTSGTRDTFVELIMNPGCESVSEMSVAYPDKHLREQVCGALREDGKYIEVGENDNLLVQKLGANPNALGIFGYSYLEENSDSIKASAIEGIIPTSENIRNKKYPVSRPLFVYVKNDHIGKIPGIKEFMGELISDAAIDNDGYLVEKGLIPLTEADRKKVQETVDGL